MNAAVRAAPGVLALQRALVWLVGASGAIVFIEPSPYEIVTLLATVTFFATGLRLSLALMPLVLMLILLNVGYTHQRDPAARPVRGRELDRDLLVHGRDRHVLRHGHLRGHGGAARHAPPRPRGRRDDRASLSAIAGYFNLVPGGRDLLTLYERARGTFKDPNVLGAFLILPALFCLQSVVSDRLAKAFRNVIAFGIMALAILLAFSRAAWGGLVLTSAFMLALMVLTSRTNAQRSRIIIMAIVAAVLGLALIAVLLSFDSTAEMFKQRASFDQSYDEGRFGRFGRHILGAEMALDLPFGIGPLQFHRFFPEDTHNSYLNAFMSGGWLSGVCYPALVFTTVIMGFRHIFVRVPWQRAYLAVFSAFVGTVGESLVIDTDHWRHFWMMLGAMWGMIAAAQAYKIKAGEDAS